MVPHKIKDQHHPCPRKSQKSPEGNFSDLRKHTRHQSPILLSPMRLPIPIPLKKNWQKLEKQKARDLSQLS